MGAWHRGLRRGDNDGDITMCHKRRSDTGEDMRRPGDRRVTAGNAVRSVQDVWQHTGPSQALTGRLRNVMDAHVDEGNWS